MKRSSTPAKALAASSLPLSTSCQCAACIEANASMAPKNLSTFSYNSLKLQLSEETLSSIPSSVQAQLLQRQRELEELVWGSNSIPPWPTSPQTLSSKAKSSTSSRMTAAEIRLLQHKNFGRVVKLSRLTQPYFTKVVSSLLHEMDI